MDFDATAAHVDMPFDVVKNEELWFRAKESRVADASGRQVVLCALGNRAWVTVVTEHGSRLGNITAQNYGGVIGKWIQCRRAVVRHKHHVGIVDALPAADRRAIKHLTSVEEALRNFLGRNSNVLFFTVGIGEAQVHPADFVFVDEF